MDAADSYLPRVIGIFLAVLDPSQSGGSKVLYQVPSNLITTSASSAPAPSLLSQSLGSLSVNDDLKSPNQVGSSSSRTRSPLRTRSRSPLSPREPLPSSSTSISSPSPPPPENQPLLNFEQIASFCVPQTPLCNRLVTVTSGAYKIQGYPTLHEDKDQRKGYERHEFRWNVCWVFDRWKYQGQEYNQVVRKVARVLASCEEDSCFISSPATGPKVFEILQQLMEDLNTYAEASIPIDQSSSIEIKLFPNLPNPLKVENWHVPIPLIDLKPQWNWDLSMAKVVRFIDGTSHVKHIAERADVAVEFARTSIEHLLYYEAIMLIDIFEWSNMYTVKPSFQTLAVADHVIDECAEYCKRDAYGDHIEWATLCNLYTKFRPGLTIDEWEETYNVVALGIDVRRFVTFGVIKGFLRRVHRWPVFRRDSLDRGEDTPMGGGLGGLGSPRLSGGESGFSLHSLGLGGLNYHSEESNSALELGHNAVHHPYDISPRATTTNLPTGNRRRAPSGPYHPSPDPAYHSSHGGGDRSTSPSSHSFSLPLTRPAPHTQGSRRRARRNDDSSSLARPWGDLGYPPTLSVDLLNGERHTDELSTEFDLPWDAEGGLEETLGVFGRKMKGEVLFVYR